MVYLVKSPFWKDWKQNIQVIICSKNLQFFRFTHLENFSALGFRFLGDVIPEYGVGFVQEDGGGGVEAG